MKKIVLIMFALSIVLSSCSDKKEIEGQLEKKYLIAQDFYNKKDLKNAEKRCDEIISINKNMPEVMILKARIFFWTDRKTEAIKLLNKIVKKNNSNLDAKLFLIKFLIETDDFTSALEFLKKAEKDNSSDYRIFNLYSLLAKRNNDLKARLAFQNKAEKCVQNVGFMYLDSAAIYKEFGMNEKSAEYLKKAEILLAKNNQENK